MNVRVLLANRWVRYALLAVPVGYLAFAQQQTPEAREQHVRIVVATTAQTAALHMEYAVGGAVIRTADLSAPAESGGSGSVRFEHRPSLPNGLYQLRLRAGDCPDETQDVQLAGGTHTLRIEACSRP